jgi:hypothetical protein
LNHSASHFCVDYFLEIGSLCPDQPELPSCYLCFPVQLGLRSLCHHVQALDEMQSQIFLHR